MDSKNIWVQEVPAPRRPYWTNTTPTRDLTDDEIRNHLGTDALAFHQRAAKEAILDYITRYIWIGNIVLRLHQPYQTWRVDKITDEYVQLSPWEFIANWYRDATPATSQIYVEREIFSRRWTLCYEPLQEEELELTQQIRNYSFRIWTMDELKALPHKTKLIHERLGKCSIIHKGGSMVFETGLMAAFTRPNIFPWDCKMKLDKNI